VRPFGLDVAKTELACACTRNNDEIDAGWHELGPQAKALPAEPLDAISRGSITNFFCDDNAKARKATFTRKACAFAIFDITRCGEKYKVLGCSPRCVGLNAQEIPSS